MSETCRGQFRSLVDHDGNSRGGPSEIYSVSVGAETPYFGSGKLFSNSLTFYQEQFNAFCELCYLNLLN